VIERLHQVISAVCPIEGVAGVQGSVTITYAPAATQPQRDAAAAALAAFDWSGAAQTLWESQKTAATIGRINPVRLTANRVNSTNVLADVADMAFQLKPNTNYIFSFTGAYTAAAATTGLSIAINGPTSPTVFRLIGCIAESATTTRQGAASAYNTALTGTASGAATALPFWVEGNITTGANAGVLQLRFASEVNGSAVTILAGSWGELKAVA
jgi:hypothetical protein